MDFPVRLHSQLQGMSEGRLQQDNLISTPGKHHKPDWKEHVAWRAVREDDRPVFWINSLISMLTGYLCLLIFVVVLGSYSRCQNQDAIPYTALGTVC